MNSIQMPATRTAPATVHPAFEWVRSEPIVALGAPWAQLAQDGTDYFDYHHTANDTLDKIDPKALDQQVAAYAALAYLAAETDVDFGRSPPPKTPE